MNNEKNWAFPSEDDYNRFDADKSFMSTLRSDPPLSSLVIHGDKGKPMLTLTHDGRFILGEGTQINEVALQLREIYEEFTGYRKLKLINKFRKMIFSKKWLNWLRG